MVKGEDMRWVSTDSAVAAALFRHHHILAIGEKSWAPIH